MRPAIYKKKKKKALTYIHREMYKNVCNCMIHHRSRIGNNPHPTDRRVNNNTQFNFITVTSKHNLYINIWMNLRNIMLSEENKS